MENRKYIIISTQELNKVDFSIIFEDSIETLRYSKDGLYTFVKFEGSTPSFFCTINDKSREYNHQEILQILSGENWS